MLEFLNRPYPFSFQPIRRIKQIIPIGICVFLFLVLFKPFVNDDDQDIIIISAYMVTCASFAALLTTVIIPLIFPKYFSEYKWTLKRNLVWVIMMNVIFVTILFFGSNIFVIYRYNSFHDLTLNKYLWYLYIQLVFGVPLGLIVNLFNQYYLLKKYLKIADKINNSINKTSQNTTTTVLEFEVDKFNKIMIEVDKLIYVEALGNYINVIYHCEEIRKISIRETISNIEQKIGASKLIYKPHRSYLVNLQNIKNVTGDSQGLKIHLKDSEKIIPVSRNKIKDFRLLVNDIM